VAASGAVLQSGEKRVEPGELEFRNLPSEKKKIGKEGSQKSSGAHARRETNKTNPEKDWEGNAAPRRKK